MIPIVQVSDVPPKLPKYVVMVRNPAGRPYLYFHRHRGTKRAEAPIRLPDDISSTAFWIEYSRLMGKPFVQQPAPGRVAALVSDWHQSPEWLALSEGTRREWTRHCKRIVEAWGNLEARGITPVNVYELRDAFAEMPATANNILRCLSSMLSWSVSRGWRKDNPCREVKPLKGGAAYAPWPWAAVDAAERELRAELWWVVALALYTGQRLGDCLAMTWGAINPSGLIAVTQEKTGKSLLIPIHRDLKTVLDAIPRRSVMILTTMAGTPWTMDGFQSSWRKAKPKIVRDMDLVFHGLRKSAVVALLEAGCTTAEVSAITGQSLRMVEHYSQKVNQEKLARTAILKWEQGSN